MERFPDRQAARQARMRIDWKYAFHQPLLWMGFHYSDLCNFRKRLLEHGAERLIFDQVLAYLREAGFVTRRGRQRTDATAVLDSVQHLSQLELVWETLRVTLGGLLSADAPQTLTLLPASFTDQYVIERRDYYLSEKEVKEQLQRAIQDSFWLLQQVIATPETWWQDVSALRILGQVVYDCGDDQMKAAMQPVEVVLRQQVVSPVDDTSDNYRDDSAPVYLETAKTAEPAAGSDLPAGDIVSPHDTDSRFARKRGDDWEGFKVHITDTAETGQPHFITDIEVTPANVSDQHVLHDIQDRLIERDIAPAQHYVDQGYMSGQHIADSAEREIDLRGRVQTPRHKAEGFSISDFDIDIDQQTATCPAGHASTRWTDVPEGSTKGVAYRAAFNPHCATCPFGIHGNQACNANQNGRRIDINRYHDTLQERRAEQGTQAFKTEMHHRNGVEGTLSEMVRAHGLRRNRYRGRAKLLLQTAFTATAVNLKRLVRAVSDPSAHQAATSG